MRGKEAQQFPRMALGMALYHPSLRVTQAYDVSLTLFMPLAAECTLKHSLFKQTWSAGFVFHKIEGPYYLYNVMV